MFNIEKIRRDFPLIWRKVNAKPLVYLDNASTSQKPQQVLDAIMDYYQHQNANIHRGVHQLSDESTQVWEHSRQKIAEFFGAHPDELIMVRNTTEALNGVAYGWADHNLSEGDVILTSLLEHHSNLVVWQEVAKRTGAKLAFANLTEAGVLDLEDFQQKLSGGNVKLLALAHVSNTLGTVNPLSEITKIVSSVYSAADRPRIVIDGAQAAPHMPISFADLGIDFYAVSGHKMLGPMGVGALLVRRELLESGEMRPWFFGGGMIASVKTDRTILSENMVDRFTPGTPDVASAVGLAAACGYLKELGMANVQEHDTNLVNYTLERLSKVPELTIVGPVSATESSRLVRLGSVSFLYQGVHSHDVAQVLDSEGIAVRSGHHCTMPLHERYRWVATTRASFQVYNSEAEIDVLVRGLEKVKKVFNI